MKYTFVFIMFAIVINASAQDKTMSSEDLSISGKIKTEKKFTLSSLDTFKKVTIGDVQFNDRKDSPYIVHNVQGILLKNIFSDVEFEPENHKAINKFYLVFEATDHFKIVFSYNEIFHPQGSANLYLVTNCDGKNLENMDDKLLIISNNDLHKGRKFIKALNKIVVKEAE